MKYYIFSLLFLITSCGYFFGKSQEINFNCDKKEIIRISPPEGTHKCTISVNEICNNNSKLYLLSGGVRSTAFNITKNSLIFQRDWYDDDLVLEYVPGGGNDFKNLRLLVVFYY